ncbi:hypothetical protein [Chitinophaga sancti]|uniref:NAD(P)-binding Rossmann-like domain-containing protein n=1 Tax=Chitinophaga sancti TaxID=1004 RepID=A0A1K1QXQ2_9BACT|nr:hypothetical protein [Chitinophaga sancti]WQD62065.1 hypothetical protein U0033_29690 [Chitinophaga sancti]WQG92366.1 hypothetical protein SR876_12695 [Chitinophaga sancti]SFW64722.1 hypothetical protein SAMN05661012_03202 [Chitinophaga sancti]
MKIAIPGAGSFGLTMASLRQQQGMDIAVYERDKASQAKTWQNGAATQEPGFSFKKRFE